MKMTKVLSGLLLFVLLGVYANAQQDARLIAEIAAGNEKTVKNAPFSAEAVSESVQVLADGNRIVRNSTSKLYRNSEGRFRREIAGGSGNLLGTYFSYGQGISILDPIAEKRLLLDTSDKIARISELRGGQGVTIAGTVSPGAKIVSKKELTDQHRAEIEAKIAAAKELTTEQKQLVEKKIAVAPSTGAVTLPALAASPSGAFAVTVGEGGFAGFYPGQHVKYETRKEDLGTRDIEGVSAIGTRSITTIPEGAIGNERPIEITYERWYSKELELVVYSKHSDPRFGDQTYTLKNIVRSEPDPSLFSVPNGYRIVTEPAGVYRLSTKPAPSLDTPRPPVAPKAATVVNVKSTKP